ncbi:MAG: hypothetical protein M1814_001682 [Vezdaea aestivalis]|nr:MAG: hypothetical protein M1814_001682 [Vezdaea aestivalis]
MADSKAPIPSSSAAPPASVPAAAVTPPITYTRLNQISTDACASTFEKVEYYEHARSAEWNSSIVNHILKALISETSSASGTPPAFKYAVNSTIIQHLTPTSALRAKAGSAGAESKGAGGETRHVGRRGMHSATGAYWNNEKDGMWSFKYEGGEEKGLDVVVCVIWMSMA